MPFVDVGMGLHQAASRLAGLVRVTSSVADHASDKTRVPFSDEEAENEYSNNNPIADLNALNAALAVISWKDLSGFCGLELEHFPAHTVAVCMARLMA